MTHVRQVPGDKSKATRALLLSLVCPHGFVRGVPRSSTTDRVVHFLKTLGASVEITPVPNSEWKQNINVTIRRPERLHAATTLDCGGSATLARLGMGLLAGLNVDATLDGSAMLRRRPMARVADPLNDWFGRDVVTLSDGCLPARVHAGPPPVHNAPQNTIKLRQQFDQKHINGQRPLIIAPSAQVRGALLFAAAAGRFPYPVALDDKGPWRTSTEDLLRELHAEELITDGERRLRSYDGAFFTYSVDVTGDPSAAAYLAALAAAVGDVRLRIQDILWEDPARSGFVRMLNRMGTVAIHGAKHTSQGPRESGLMWIERRNPLVGLGVDGLDDDPIWPWSCIDEVPLLAALCALATTPSLLPKLSELRVKESDRLARTADMLRAFGAEAYEQGDALVIEPAPLHAPRDVIRTDHDHRIAMTALTLAKILNVDVELDDEDCVDESWPAFRDVLNDTATKLRAEKPA